MSTFNGIVKEFPKIQFDYFRRVEGHPPSLANFLSHIHSDHLTGLAGKAYRAPFIYCSAATKQLLLKLERRAHRFNRAKGHVECHEYSYIDYAGRDRILRELPLETPTLIELHPNYTIRVTLFDANHCPGATMFLVESVYPHPQRAILYTGDIRAEPWWLARLSRHPILIPYFTPGLKKLDCLYLDTTHAAIDHSHLVFTPKSEGLQELLSTIARYPPDTVFHLNTWTLGYEDAWMAISAAFGGEKIHLDEYRMRLYGNLAGEGVWEHGPFLLGRKDGRIQQEGVLTKDPNVRFHSCERWLECEVRDREREEGRLVEISPLVARYKDPFSGMRVEVKEPGEGGGNIDANALEEIPAESLLLLAMFSRDAELTSLIKEVGIKEGYTLPLRISNTPRKDLPLDNFIADVKQSLQSLLLARQTDQLKIEDSGKVSIVGKDGLPRWFGFPYARHSSFTELQSLVAALRPADVYPCVAAEGSWYQRDSIRKLFGKYCSGDTFAFDIERNLHIDQVTTTRREMEEHVLSERRAAGMDDESQQREKDALGSDEYYRDYQRNNGNEKEDEEDDGEEYDDDWVNVEMARRAEEAIRVSRGTTAMLPPKRFGRSNNSSNGGTGGQTSSSPDTITRMKVKEEGITLCLSETDGGYKEYAGTKTRLSQSNRQATTTLPTLHQILGPRPAEDAANISRVEETRFEELSSTQSGDGDGAANGNGNILDYSDNDEMDCSQDSSSTNFGDLDEEHVRQVMEAVRAGEWHEVSSRMHMNNSGWRYQKEEEL